MTCHSSKSSGKSTHQRASCRRSRVAHIGFFDYYGSGRRGIVNNNHPQGVGRVRVITKMGKLVLTIVSATGRMQRRQLIPGRKRASVTVQSMNVVQADSGINVSVVENCG
jgi:hypothetical protein